MTTIDVAPNPHWVAFTPDGSRSTANHDSNVVSAIDTATNTVITTIPVPTSPHSIAVHPTRPILIVATYDADSASVIDTDTNMVLADIPVGRFPQHAAWSADGRFAYITNNEDNSISVIDGETFLVTATIPTGESPHHSPRPAGRQPGLRQQSSRRHAHRAGTGGVMPPGGRPASDESATSAGRPRIR